MYSAADLRKGLKVQIDGEPYIVTDFEFSKPGKGQALYRTKMRSLISGNQLVNTYRSNDKFDTPALVRKAETFLQELSTWYVRRCRRRFWRPKSADDREHDSGHHRMFHGNSDEA